MQQWYITFHGGTRHAWNNIHRFDPEGRLLGTALAVETLPSHLALRELRGFTFGPDGDLYVANAWREASQVLRFGGRPGDDGRHPFREVFVEQHRANPGMSHPFDVAFGPDGHLYVASQDTNVVGRYYGPMTEQAGRPMPHPSALRHGGSRHQLPGTFVPPARLAPDGLHAVRRAIFGPNGDLYVADRDAGSVKRYDATSGAYQREYRHHHLGLPVHLAFRPSDGILLVGSRDRHAIFAVDTDAGHVEHLIEPGAGGLRAPGGMAFDPDGRLYVCSRETAQILRFDAFSGTPDPEPFIDELGDAPEFIALVDS